MQAALLITAILISATTDVSVVRIETTPKGFQLVRNGQPYLIKGAGGHSRVAELVTAGGNSVRTWHAENMGKCLDDAQDAGLTVTLGLWLGHERHGFRYDDPESVAAQRAQVAEAVKKYKDHPALLMWGIGNEMEGDGRNPAVWKEVNVLAAMVKKEDPNHPVMTVIAGGGEKLGQFKKFCPDVDVLGINAYGDLSSLAADLRKNNLSRPFVLTEFGPTGWWQVAKTSWEEEIEPTSSEKEQSYLAAYKAIVRGFPHECLGSYAFLWGQKQEHTHTWFGMFLSTGERTPTVDAMTYAWSGKWPKNRCPKVTGLNVRTQSSSGKKQTASELVFRPGTEMNCKVQCRDPDGDKLTFKWELRGASTDKRSGGDPEKVPSMIPEAIVSQDGANAVIRCPDNPGAFRIFVYALDGHGNAGTANVPILVRNLE
jgi:hypothetical protein